MKIAMLIVLLLYTQISVAISGGKKLYNTKTAQDSIKLTHTFQELDSLIEQNKTKDLKKTSKYLKEYIDKLVVSKQYDKAFAKAYEFLGDIDKPKIEGETTIAILDNLNLYKSYIKDSTTIGKFYYAKAGYYFYGRDLVKAKENFTNGLLYFTKKDSATIAGTYLRRGDCLYRLGNFLEARKDYEMAAEYFKNLNNKSFEIYSLVNITNIFTSLGFYEEATEQRELLIKKKIENNFTNEYALSKDYSNLAVTYNYLDRKEKVEECLLSALKYVQIENNHYGNLIDVYLSLANFYSEINPNKSKKYFNLAAEAEQNKKVYQNPSDIFFNDLYKAEYYLNTGQYQKAITIGEKILQESEKNKTTSIIRSIFLVLSESYEKTGSAANALKFYKRHTKEKDSIQKIKNIRAFSYYQSLYETEKKDREIDQQKSEINLLNNKNEYQKRVLLFGGILTVLFFTLILLLRKRAQLKKEKILQEQFSQQILSTQESERQRIAKDLHDSLGQNLMLLKNNISLTSDEKNGKLVDEAINEMRIISSMLHPYELIEQGLYESIQKLIHKLNDNYKELNIFMELSHDIDKLEKEKVINFYRIIQEILSNAIKHSNAKYINLKITEKNKQISLRVKDDGKGFDYAQKLSDVQTMGIRTIKERVKLLNGTLNLVTAVDQGTEFKIKVPL